MKFFETPLKGSYLIQLEPFADLRGTFVRMYCEREFYKNGIKCKMVQTNISSTSKKGTIRGMHYQVNGSEEDKLVRCVHGRVLDVIIDLRKYSPTYCEYYSVEITEKNNLMIFIPKGFAHGFLSLENDTTIIYQVSNFYNNKNERGIRWNDQSINIKWPINQPIISIKDSSYEDYVI